MRTWYVVLALLALVSFGSARAQVIEIPIDYVATDSVIANWPHLNIGGNPVYKSGYPADSLAVHAARDGWFKTTFNFPVGIYCLDKDGKIIKGRVEPGQTMKNGARADTLIVSILAETPEQTLYQIHVIQACGNPVLWSGVGVLKAPKPTGPLPPPTLTVPKPPAPPPIAETEPPIVVEPEKHFRLPIDGWAGVAGSKSLESKAWSLFEGVYIDFPLIVDKLTFKFGAATSQANYEKLRGRTSYRGVGGDMSRWQVGLFYRPWDNIQVTGLIGQQYDHKAGDWQDGVQLEGVLGFPIGRWWNDEDVSYGTTTKALWFRTRHAYKLSGEGMHWWSIGGEFVYDSFMDNDGRFYTSRVHVFGKREFPGFWNREAVFIFGGGRGSKDEAWGLIAELGQRLWF